MKKFKTLGYVLSLALGMTMLTGCGKKVDGVDQQSMIDKYAAYCDLPDYKGLEYEETKLISLAVSMARNSKVVIQMALVMT